MQSRPMKDYERPMVKASWTPSVLPGRFESVCLSFTVGVCGIFVVSLTEGEDLIYLFAYLNMVGLSAQCLTLEGVLGIFLTYCSNMRKVVTAI